MMNRSDGTTYADLMFAQVVLLLARSKMQPRRKPNSANRLTAHAQAKPISKHPAGTICTVT
jgi:hypothetical protein